MKALLPIILTMLLFSGCGGSDGKRSSEPLPTPVVDEKPPEYVYFYLDSKELADNNLNDYQLSYFDQRWEKINGLDFVRSETYPIIKVDISKLDSFQTEKLSSLPLKLTAYGERVLKSIFTRNDNNKRFVYVNQYTSVFSQVVESIYENSSIKSEIVTEYLNYLDLSDLNNDTKVTEADIGLFDSGFHSSPKGSMILNKLSQNSNLSAYALFLQALGESKKIWPFELIQHSSTYVDMKVQDYLYESVDGAFFSIKTACENTEYDSSMLISASESFSISDNCRFTYQLCHDEGFNCSGIETIYYYNKEFTKYMPANRVLTSNADIGIYNIANLRKLEDFDNQYQAIINLQEAKEVKQFLACQLIKSHGYYCDDFGFKFE
ncbi:MULTISPECIES: hypothetical protein [unclassified Pseudoalteromonas]|uniref:hypothetical protein n=1 Tax=unclassified Pseudoalteromonas TaxID=194690 RepID=UPI0005A83026|nr:MULTISPECIES: hypothetical protein [unclassified Pseudoalteromonas]